MLFIRERQRADRLEDVAQQAVNEAIASRKMAEERADRAEARADRAEQRAEERAAQAEARAARAEERAIVAHQAFLDALHQLTAGNGPSRPPAATE